MTPPASPSRRAVLGAGLATLALPMLGRSLRAQDVARRSYRVYRGGSHIGSQVTEVTRDGARAIASVRIRLEVSPIGITLYRYELDSREVWEDGALVSLDGDANDNGDRTTARVRRENGRLVSSGTWQGDLPEDCATTSYWTQAFLSRSVWVSTQTGRPLSVETRRDGTERIPAFDGMRECARWRVTGDLPLTIFYDDRDEWMGNAFDASGQPARFRADSETGRLAPFWPAG